MAKSAPDPPDYAAAAEKQGQSSREVTEQQTWANRPTENTPFGQQTWEVTPTWDPATNQYINSWTQNTNLTPQAQQALNSQMDVQQGRSDLAASMIDRTKSEYGSPMDWNKFDPMSQTPDSQNLQMGVGNTPDYDQRAEDALYGKFSSRMDPQFQREQDQKRTQLYNTGLREGDEAYDQAMKQLGQNQGDQRQQAMYQSIIGGGAEAQRMQGMDIAAGGFQNQAANQALNQDVTRANYGNTLRQQQISEEMQKRGLTINEMNAILTGQQVGMPSMPGFQNAGKSETVQYNQAAQNQYQGQLDQFNANQQATQGLMSGAMGGAMMFSDRRVKENIHFMGFRHKGLKVYKFNYVWDRMKTYTGFMADEVEKIFPEAVVIGPLGYKMVNYGAL